MKKFGLFFILAMLLSPLFGWDDLAHRIITEQAMWNLPDEMSWEQNWKSYVVEHCIDPDLRKDETPGEEEKHFIDIDYYEEFNRGEMIIDKAALMAKYGEEVVIDQGILPWAILETYQKTVQAFRNDDEAEILLTASDLAHYIEDASQPQHTIVNYNGKLNGQRGIHHRYEEYMIERYEPEFRQATELRRAEKIGINLPFIFEFIYESNSLNPLIFAADLHALQYTTEYDDEYYRLFYFKTKYITEIQFNKTAWLLSSFLYSAWLEADNHPKQ